MVTSPRSPLMNVMIRAAEKAGKGLVRDFGEVEHLQVSRKGPSDFVSAADHRAEKTIFESLSKARPDFSFIMEESGEVQGKDKDSIFLVDPLDGTANFIHGIPQFAVSIGCQQKGQIVAGVVYNPISDEMFWAEKGAGAYLNARRLRVAGRTQLQDCMLATGVPCKGRGDHPQFLKDLSLMMETVAGVRRMGAAALDLCYLAAGRVDAYFERGIHSWDVAAGAIIVKESGGTVSEINGGDNYIYGRTILAANGTLHKDLKDALKTTA